MTDIPAGDAPPHGTAKRRADPAAVCVDRRIIAFGPAMIHAAVEACARERMDLPPHGLAEAVPLPAEQAVRLRFGGGSEAVDRVVDAGEMAALLIAFCIGARIPLPRRASKTVTVTSAGVVLDFLVTLGSPPRFERPHRPPPVRF